MGNMSNLTKRSLHILCKTVTLLELEAWCRITDPAECIAYENSMIAKYGFKVK